MAAFDSPNTTQSSAPGDGHGLSFDEWLDALIEDLWDGGSLSLPLRVCTIVICDRSKNDEGVEFRVG